MQNFSIHFLYPWLLLLFIPAIGLTLFTHFATAKKYRNTRNKIISIVLHSIVMTLAILILSGMTFHWEIPNNDNELIILADFSDTQYEAQLLDPSSDEYNPVYFTRDDFIQSIINESGSSKVKVGIVGFGMRQVYIAPITNNVDELNKQYRESLDKVELSNGEFNIDTSATDIKDALIFAAEQFEHPETAKILLVSDGYETDESVASTITQLIRMGIQVDTVRFDDGYADDGMQIVGVGTPDYYFKTDEQFEVSITTNTAKMFDQIRIQVFDGDDSIYDEVRENVNSGINVMRFNTSFAEEGLHLLRVRISLPSALDIDSNNEYFVYINLEKRNKVLVLEQREEDSVKLKEILDEDKYETKVINFNGDTTDLPKNVEEFRAFDQVILNNISPKDIDAHGGDGFIDNLHEYVKVYGGGLLTFGGRDNDGELHAYNKDDFKGSEAAKSASALQEMLPVYIEAYRPPLGAVFIGDFSGSMAGYIGTVRKGIVDCINNGAILPRDYVGVMTLTDSYTMGSLSLIPGTDKPRILDAISKLNDGGGTNFFPAVRAAITVLNNNRQIANKHIVIFTDGAFSEKDEDIANISKSIKESNQDITLSIVLMMNTSQKKFENITKITDVWGGKTYNYDESKTFYSTLHDDLDAESISGKKDEVFKPVVSNKTSSLLRGLDPKSDYDIVSGEFDFTFGGYYGSRARADADVIIEGPYKVPIYAQWTFGIGKVGSFMSDAYNHTVEVLGDDAANAKNYAGEFLEAECGKKLLKNMIANVMPTENIRYTDITLSLNPNPDENYNYYNNLGIYHAPLNDGEVLEGRIEFMDGTTKNLSLNEVSSEQSGDCYVRTAMTRENDYSRVEFVMKKAGTYRIVVEKKNGETVLSSAELYNSFSYSKEFNFYNRKDPVELLTELNTRTGGHMIDINEPEMVYDDFEKSFSRSYDPRMLFFIIAIICFLLDIAVRKFRFKWIHEIIRERRLLKEKNK